MPKLGTSVVSGAAASYNTAVGLGYLNHMSLVLDSFPLRGVVVKGCETVVVFLGPSHESFGLSQARGKLKDQAVIYGRAALAARYTRVRAARDSASRLQKAARKQRPNLKKQ